TRYITQNVGKINSNPFRATAGLQGLVTTKLTTLLQIGYGNGFYAVDPSPSTLVATAELGWIVGPFARAKVGYTHDFTNSIYGNFYDLDGIYASWIQQVGRSFSGGLSLRYEHRNYHCPPGSMSTTISCFQDMNGNDRIDNWVLLN